MSHHGWDPHRKKKKQPEVSRSVFLRWRPVSKMAASILKKTDNLGPEDEVAFQTPFFRDQLLFSRLQMTILRKACC